jgi:hypothetical protein
LATGLKRQPKQFTIPLTPINNYFFINRYTFTSLNTNYGPSFGRTANISDIQPPLAEMPRCPEIRPVIGI